MSKAEIEFAAENAEKLDDLISRSAVLEMASTAICAFAQPARVVTVHDINRLPAVDAVEVVRCKDCKHSELEFFADNGTTRTERYKCFHHRMGINVLEHDDFCSYGERRADHE